jgi:hypothetical protein
MDNPEGYAATNPDIVNVQYYGDTKYITVAPRTLPLVQPLHDVGLGFVANLMEPALRVIIEETGYDRSIPYGQPTPFRLIPIFNPITLTIDVIAAIPEGIEWAMNGGPPPLTPPETTSMMALSSDSVDSPKTVDLSKDGTADPESGLTTSNGGGTTLQKTAVDSKDSVSGTHGAQSNATDVKQVDPTTQDVTKDSEETKKDTEGTKKDRDETKKDPDETKKGRSGGSISLTFSPKKPTDGDTGGATASQNDPTGDTTSTDGTESEQAAA